MFPSPPRPSSGCSTRLLITYTQICLYFINKYMLKHILPVCICWFYYVSVNARIWNTLSPGYFFKLCHDSFLPHIFFISSLTVTILFDAPCCNYISLWPVFIIRRGLVQASCAFYIGNGWFIKFIYTCICNCKGYEWVCRIIMNGQWAGNWTEGVDLCFKVPSQHL